MAGYSVRVAFNFGPFQQHVKNRLAGKLALAGEALRSQMVKNISLPTRTLGPSRPGAFPHRDTGDLAKSIFSAVDPAKLQVIVGSNLNYSAFLELGTSKMEARPFMRRTLAEMVPRLERIIGSKPGGFSLGLGAIDAPLHAGGEFPLILGGGASDDEDEQEHDQNQEGQQDAGPEDNGEPGDAS